MQKLGKDLDSKSYWEHETKEYDTVLENKYHTHRLGVIKELIPKDLFQSGKRVLDFGCGNAVLIPDYIKAGVDIRGIDMTPAMIKSAQERIKKLGGDPNSVRQGMVTALREEKAASYDALTCFNVLAYFTAEEDRIFYEEASRIIKPGGYLIVTHGNELFDMFTFNKFTVEFINKFFVTDPSYAARIGGLLANPDKPGNALAYNVRENPLTFQFKAKKYGFREVRQEFINRHMAPPLIYKEETYPNTIGLPEEEKWKLMFTCSTYGSCSVKV